MQPNRFKFVLLERTHRRRNAIGKQKMGALNKEDGSDAYQKDEIGNHQRPTNGVDPFFLIRGNIGIRKIAQYLKNSEIINRENQDQNYT